MTEKELESEFKQHLQIMDSLKNRIEKLEDEVKSLQRNNKLLKHENTLIFQSLNTFYGANPNVKKIYIVKVGKTNSIYTTLHTVEAKTKEEAINKVKNIMRKLFPISEINDLLFEVQE